VLKSLSSLSCFSLFPAPAAGSHSKSVDKVPLKDENNAVGTQKQRITKVKTKKLLIQGGEEVLCRR